MLELYVLCIVAIIAYIAYPKSEENIYAAAALYDVSVDNESQYNDLKQALNHLPPTHQDEEFHTSLPVCTTAPELSEAVVNHNKIDLYDNALNKYNIDQHENNGSLGDNQIFNRMKHMQLTERRAQKARNIWSKHSLVPIVAYELDAAEKRHWWEHDVLADKEVVDKSTN